MFSTSQLSQSLSLATWRAYITQHYCVDEATYVEELIHWLGLDKPTQERILRDSKDLTLRWQTADKKNTDWAQAFLQEYALNSREGVALMCLAEALIRIPNAESARAFIKDKIHSAQWSTHAHHSPHWFVNAATWGLALGDELIASEHPQTLLSNLIQRLGEPILHKALEQAVRWLGDQFVFAPDLASGLVKAQDDLLDESILSRYCYSFDLLGEAALSESVAITYRDQYLHALAQLNAVKQARIDYTIKIPHHFTLSIKLSALHPRYDYFQHHHVMKSFIGDEKNPGYLVLLAQKAFAADIPLTIDAEESDRLELSLDIITALLHHPSLKGWKGFGLAVQAYSKRALPTLAFLNQLAKECNTTINVRLVKGAYWDSEIQWAQRAGLSGYPVFTHKSATDISYLACAKYLLNADYLNPQFATHNAHTICSILQMNTQKKSIEFQRLHGMGESLYHQVLQDHADIHCRIYSPIGNHADLLPYLVRRLLENGANSSFVNQVNQQQNSLDELIKNPIDVYRTRSLSTVVLPTVGLPTNLFTHENVRLSRINSQGTAMAIESLREPLLQAIHVFQQHTWKSLPIVGGEIINTGERIDCINPANTEEVIGHRNNATPAQVSDSIRIAAAYFPQWRITPVNDRAALLDKIAIQFEKDQAELIALLIREAGKTINDAIDEVREAIDFCRYYAQQARQHLYEPTRLPAPTGERNDLHLEGRGVFVCLSPWNFPLAIFTGQIVAALVTGNCVLAKPAQQTSLIAYRAIELMLAAGVPPQALHFVPGKSSELAPALLQDSRISGVAFTGSTQSAWQINRTLAARDASIATFIAETGGQNAMIADATTLPEQLVKDVIRSAFGSAGQRCSALRVLYVQDDIADKVIELLCGAMRELVMGDPSQLSTDIGPCIDQASQRELQDHIDALTRQQKIIFQASLTTLNDKGFFIAPTLAEINSIHELKQEHFGPICHLIRFSAAALDTVIADINAVGYGLTLGVHTRNENLAQHIAQAVNVGNVYINRSMIGAVVGMQPFGGCGLSGTGPKAGGPHYLLRFSREKTITCNTAAIGGNVELLSSQNRFY